MNATPTPDAVLAALCSPDFDLPKAAAALGIPLTRLLALLRTPEFRQPLEDLHALTKLLLDLRSARAITRAIALLDTADADAADPPERRKVAAGLTRAANTAARLGPPRTKKPAGQPEHATAATTQKAVTAHPAPTGRCRIEDLPPQHPEGLPETLKEVYARCWHAAADYFVADPPRISGADYARIFAEWERARQAHEVSHAVPAVAPAQAA